MVLGVVAWETGLGFVGWKRAWWHGGMVVDGVVVVDNVGVSLKVLIPIN